MAARVHPVSRGRVLGRRLLAELIAEADRARVGASLSHAAVGEALGLSSWQVGRLLRGETDDVGVIRVAELLAATGLKLAASAYPIGTSVRDAAQLVLLERLRARIHPSLRWRTEVPVVEHVLGTGDLRAWDAAIDGGGAVVRVEAETRLRDVQEVQRRIGLKQRDGAVPVVILLVSDTQHNRRAIRLAATSLRAQFPTGARHALRLLRDGRAPDGNVLIVL